MSSYKTFANIYLAYTVFLSIYLISNYRFYEDDTYLECIKNCNENKTICHKNIRFVEKLIANRESFIVEKRNVGYYDVYSDKFPNYTYDNPLAGTDDYECYHHTSNNPPRLFCYCSTYIQLLDRILTSLWFISSFLLFVFY